MPLKQMVADAKSKMRHTVDAVIRELATMRTGRASVAMLDGTDVIYIAHHSTQRARRASATLGARYPAHATSLGRVLLAGLPDDQLDRAFEQMTPVELTSRTVTSKEELRRLVWKARDLGYAYVSADSLL